LNKGCFCKIVFSSHVLHPFYRSVFENDCGRVAGEMILSEGVNLQLLWPTCLNQIKLQFKPVFLQ
jgi:hypothetical protein